MFNQDELMIVPIDRIVVNPYQPRRVFSDQPLKELAASIRSVGILHPPLVRRQGEFYELISGERRYLAAKKIGLDKIPVQVRNAPISHSAKAALIENIQREDLNPIEVSLCLSRLRQDFSYSQEQLAELVGKPRSTIANFLRLITLSQEIQQSISEGKVSLGQAKVLLSVQDPSSRKQMYERILQFNPSVRELEAQIKKKKPKVNLDCHVESIREKIEKKLGMKVSMKHRGSKGLVQIEYQSLDELDHFLDQMDVQID